MRAQEHQHGASRDQFQVQPGRAAEPPTIDGLLDEAVWRTAARIESFTQQEPSDGEPATERTEVQLLYDANALYIAVHAYDSDPAGVIATEMRRDSLRMLEEDNFQLILDTFRDSRSGYMFVTNPLGAKLEQQVFEEGGGNARGSASNINRDWNGVWSAASQRTSDGWTAEIMIPMVTLRSPDVESQVWGINFMRNIRRKNEQVYWAPIPKPYGLTQVSMAGTMGGMTSLTRGLDLRVKPFVVAGARRDRSGDTVVRDPIRDVGLDVKYGLGSGLALDVTLNTDFAQAEVDEQQVNLTRFPLFFPEKRDFFLENSGQFTVGNQGTDRLLDLFFSRRIGLSDAGQPIPIVGGARMTGKVGSHNLAVMDIQTDRVFEKPGDNFFVARYSKDLFGRSKVGGLVINKETARSRALQPDDRGRYDDRADAQPELSLVPRAHVDARRQRRPAGVSRPRAPAEHQVADLRGVHRHRDQFQRRGRLRPAHGHPDDETAHRAESAARQLDPGDGADVQHHQHDGSAQPSAHAPAASHGGHEAQERRVHQRDVQPPASIGWMCRSSCRTR